MGTFLFFVFGTFFCFFDWSCVSYLVSVGFFYFVFCWGGLFGHVVMVDGLSFIFVLLSFWVFFLVFFTFLPDFGGVGHFSLFGFFYFSSLGGVFLCFAFFDLFGFYISFEGVFVCFFVLLFLFGYSPERFQASFYMLFYTLLVSFPFLVFVLGLYLDFSLSFFFLSYFGGGYFFWWCFCFLVFFVKVPVFFVHLWLPKAHVEAPLFGSMVLAGVLIKLGGYGIIRVLKFFFSDLFFYSGYFFGLGFFGGAVVSFLCLFQSDCKSLVAYSSVVHMGVMLGGVFSYTVWGVVGGVSMMISHGLVSSCLFFLLYVFYVRLQSRSVMFFKGVLGFSGVFSFCWFFFIFLNLAVPPSLGFFSEVLTLSGILSFGMFNFFLCFLVLFVSGLYCVYLFSVSGHGSGYQGLGFFVYLREYFSFFMHSFPVFFLVVFFSVFF